MYDIIMPDDVKVILFHVSAQTHQKLSEIRKNHPNSDGKPLSWRQLMVQCTRIVYPDEAP